MNNEEYAEVFSHEYGHFVDDQKGNISDTDSFRRALNDDLLMYDRSSADGRQNFDDMMNSLMNSDAAYDRAVSDNMSALFVNDPDIVSRYWNEGIDYYQHDNNYWMRPGNREAEIYANSFSMLAQSNSVSCAFMQSHFPKAWQHFRSTL